MLDVLCVGVPMTTLRFGNSLGELSGLGTHSYALFQQKDTEHSQQKESCMGWSPEEAAAASLSTGKRKALHSPRNELWQHLSHVAKQGHSLEIQCPRLSRGLLI